MNIDKSNLNDIWKKFRKNKLAVISMFLILIFIISAFFAPIISPYDPALQNMSYDGIPQPPSFKHLFGTDNYGRDLFSRAIFGTRISLLVGFGAVGIYIPTFFFILALQVLLTQSVWNVILVIGFTNWAGPTRLMRAQALSLKESLFVEASKSFGAKKTHIIFRHIIPNAMSPMIVTATLGIASAILMESTLSFLGLGVQEPTASWGNMLMRAQEYMTTAPWMAIFPGILIMLLVISFNFLGDGLRDAFDPKTN